MGGEQGCRKGRASLEKVSRLPAGRKGEKEVTTLSPDPVPWAREGRQRDQKPVALFKFSEVVLAPGRLAADVGRSLKQKEVGKLLEETWKPDRSFPAHFQMLV